MTPIETGKSSIPKTKKIATQSIIAMKFGFQLAYKFRVAIIRVFLLLVLSLFLISFFFFTIRLVIVLTKAAPALVIKWSGEYFLK